MRIRIDKNDSLPKGEYELTDRNKLERAKGKLPFGSSDRQILLEYDRIAGHLLKDGVVLSPQSIWYIEGQNMNQPIEQFTDEELLIVIRRAENTDISGSLYQKAYSEQQIRHQQKLLDATKDARPGISITAHNVTAGDLIGGDKIGRGGSGNQKGFWAEYWWRFAIPIAVFVIGFVITEGRIPALFKTPTVIMPINSDQDSGIATGPINISAIFAGYDDRKYISDKREFLNTYINTRIQGFGSFVDRDKRGDRYIITLQVSDKIIDCSFGTDSETEKRLLLLSKSQPIAFSGVFTANVHGDGHRGWIVNDCELK